MGKHAVKNHVFSVEVQGKQLTAPHIPTEEEVDFVRPKYKLKHFKISDLQLMGGPTKIMQGMNTANLTPKVNSQTEVAVFGWELNDSVGRVTFEGMVYNRRPRFDLRLLYSLPDNMEPETMELRFWTWDAQSKQERFKLHEVKVNRGETIKWQERVM